MKLFRIAARLSALAFAVAVVASCDTRLPTSSGNSLFDDVERPQIKFTLSAGTNNTVDVSTPLTVTVTATDNGGVSTMLTRISNASQVIGVDTVTYKPTVLTATRIVPVPLTGLSRGDRLTIRSTVSDGAMNVRTDSVIVTIADSSGPTLTVSSNKAGRTVKGGDTVDVRVTASDSSGIVYAGYRLLRVRATDSVLVRVDSTLVPAGTRPTIFQPAAYSFVIPDTMLTGNYAVVGFALDRSGVLARGGASTVNFTVIDVKKPTLTFIAPTVGAKLNVGDSLLITARLQDNIALQRVSFSGRSSRGNPALGTADTVTRYGAVSVPASGSFRVGVRDTTVQRYLKVLTPLDTLTDSLIVMGVLTDASDNVDTVRLKIRMVNGPNVTFLAPILGDSATAGSGLTVSLRAVSSVGVLKLGFRAQSEAGWPTPIDTTIFVVYSPALKTAQMQGSVRIPANAPLKGLITLTPISLDASGQDGSSTPFIIAVRAGPPPAPRVTQTIASRIETMDTLFVTAVGNNLTYVGFEAIDDATGTLIKRDSIAVTPLTPVPFALPLNFATSVQGKRVRIRAFAYDDGGRIGYSVRATSLTQTTALAAVDTSLVVYGRTYALPINRNGVIADLAIDPARGNVFLSNINYGRLEVWSKASQSFDANGVIVGSQPWGMTMSRFGARDTLFVANSGGTNLSRVYVGAATPTGMREDLNGRLKTRISLLYKVTEVRDQNTGKIRITVAGPILFSDRPQFVEQGSSGLLYLSTKPTAAAPRGTVRYLNPSKAAPDERFMLDFATTGNDPNSWLVGNVDGASVIPAPANSTVNDSLKLCDHASGTTNVSTCVTSPAGIQATVDALRLAVVGTDVDARPNLDENSLGLTDTTFAAASGNGKVITFGQGNTKGQPAKNFIAFDDPSSPDAPTSASPAINITDLINNASDEIFGVALDKSGQTIGIHGKETYFAAVAYPFTQRLQGKKTTFSKGAGIAFHPNADGTTSAAADRLAFVASANGSIEAVDIAYYDFSRGSLATKFNLYGPLRATLPFPGDDPSIVFKLFGLSPTGLVVIDVTAADIAAGP